MAGRISNFEMSEVKKLKRDLAVVRRQKTFLQRRVAELERVTIPEVRHVVKWARRVVSFRTEWNDRQLRLAVERFEARRSR
jgi:hypothetical protein